jgi:hypothetical protein
MTLFPPSLLQEGHQPRYEIRFQLSDSGWEP